MRGGMAYKRGRGGLQYSGVVMAAVQRLTGHQNYVWTASFSLDGSRVVTCSSDETARVWSLAGGGTTASMQHTTHTHFNEHTDPALYVVL